MNKTPSEMTQQELYLEIARLAKENDKLKRTKKFGLVWENKNDAKVEEVRRSAPILVEDSTKRVINDPNDVNHVLINGDNFQAMTALRATHAGKVDVIYIDPPYNTGNKDFIYNDNYLDKEDGYRHSKWLSFMQKRLILARELLSETGVIFVSIDDNEQARLKLLMDDIFGAENFIDTIMVELSATQGMKVGAAKNGAIVKNGEYVLVYAKSATHETAKRTPLYNRVNGYDTHYNLWLGDNGELATIGQVLYDNVEIREELERLGFKPRNNSFSINVLNECIDFSDKIQKFVLDHSEWMVRYDRAPSTLSGRVEDLERNHYEVIDNGKRSYILGKDSNGQVIQYFPLSMNLRLSDDFRPSKGRTVIRGDFWKDFWIDMGNISKEGGIEFKNGKKPVRLIKQIVKWAVGANPNAIVLDFFAGSGTTAHAVAELNKEDGGRRQCILITDGGKTETTGESSKNASENAVNIAEEITYERVKRVLTGKGWADGKEHEPLGGNLFYLNTVMKYVGTIDAKSKEPYFCPSNSTAFSLDTGVWHPILEEVGASAEWPFQKRDYKLFALPKGEDGKQNYALTINTSDWEFTAFKEWFDENMPEDSTVFLYADNYSHGGCEWMEELEMAKDPRLAEVNITKRLVNNHNWVAHSCLKTDI